MNCFSLSFLPSFLFLSEREDHCSVSLLLDWESSLETDEEMEGGDVRGSDAHEESAHAPPSCFSSQTRSSRETFLKKTRLPSTLIFSYSRACMHRRACMRACVNSFICLLFVFLWEMLSLSFLSHLRECGDPVTLLLYVFYFLFSLDLSLSSFSLWCVAISMMTRVMWIEMWGWVSLLLLLFLFFILLFFFLRTQTKVFAGSWSAKDCSLCLSFPLHFSSL